MRRYSNPPGMVADLGALLLPPTHRNTIETEIQPPAQHQRRLRQDEVARLVEDYVSGVSVDDLVVAHGVNRTTVYAHLDRGGIERPRGVGKLSAGQVRHAAELYENGDLRRPLHPNSGLARRLFVGHFGLLASNCAAAEVRD